jgi:intracellular sulfur oxidation DsrE/DsrF family protein
MADHFPIPLRRRSFLSRLAGATAFLGLGAGPAAAQSSGPSRFQPARHAEDDWLDSLPGKHRVIIDTVSTTGAGEGIGFATNIFAGSANGYGLADADTAIVLCLRHFATAFAWTDAIWAKYGATIGADLKFDDPRTKRPPVINVYNTSGYGEALPNRNIALDALAKRGVHFAVCGLATRRMASVIARATGASADALLKELSSSMIPNAHLAPAGVVAVNRAQERGYTLLYVG